MTRPLRFQYPGAAYHVMALDGTFRIGKPTDWTGAECFSADEAARQAGENVTMRGLTSSSCICQMRRLNISIPFSIPGYSDQRGIFPGGEWRRRWREEVISPGGF